MTKPPRPSLAAVVVTFNRITQMQVTLTRLLAEAVDHVVVVDNGSEDGTRDWLATQTDPRLHLILPKENLGGAGGFELGLRETVERFDPDWIVVMDDDARPEPGTFAAFGALDHKGWDAVAAAAYYPDGRICEMNRPAVNPFWNLGVFMRTLMGGGRMGFHLPDQVFDGPGQAIDVASFVGLFLSRHAIATAGYPDGRLFLYADDSLYTLGLREKGLTIRFAPALRFEHDCSTFEGGARVYKPLWKVYYNYRNGLFLYHKAAGPWFWLVILIVVPKWAWNGRKYGADRGAFYRLLWRAVRDGVRSRPET